MVDSPQAAKRRLTGKRVLITGAGSGVGRAITLLAAREGAAAICAADADLSAATQAIDSVSGGFALHVDVARPDSVEAMVRTARRQMGGIDVLATAARSGSRAAFLDASEEEWHLAIDVDLGGPFWCGQAVGRVMAEQASGGAIVHFSAFVEHDVETGGTLQAASNGAVSTLTYAMAVGLAPYGVRVNAVGQLGAPEDIAAAVIFLASDDAAYVNGAVFAVDGGLSVAR